jgi:hypothetical protein
MKQSSSRALIILKREWKFEKKVNKKEKVNYERL